ncbi:unnamed protein product [Trichobilharzia szidati]|nr:unnamed protein product [Trichobilharzia szidati]
MFRCSFCCAAHILFLHSPSVEVFGGVNNGLDSRQLSEFCDEAEISLRKCYSVMCLAAWRCSIATAKLLLHINENRLKDLALEIYSHFPQKKIHNKQRITLMKN